MDLHKIRRDADNKGESNFEGGLSMKRYAMLALALVLMCSLFAGCRRMDTMPANPTNGATKPTTEPTTAVTIPTTSPTTEATIIPPTDATTGTDATLDPTENTLARNHRDTMR